MIRRAKLVIVFVTARRGFARSRTPLWYPDGAPLLCRHCGVHTFSRPPINSKLWVVNLRCAAWLNVEDLALGTWQGIYLWEHRVRPHRREVALHLLGE